MSDRRWPPPQRVALRDIPVEHESDGPRSEHEPDRPQSDRAANAVIGLVLALALLFVLVEAWR